MYFLALFKLALRNLMRHRRRSLIAILSVGFGIASLVIASAFIEWMFVDFREATIESQYSHIQITRPGYHENGRSDPFRYLLPPDVQAESLNEVRSIRSWGPRLGFTGLISRGDSTMSFVGEGFDPAKDLTDDRSLTIVQGAKLTPADKGKIMLGRGLANILGVKPGDDVVLLVETPGSGLGATDAKVGAIFESVSKAYDDSAILIPIGMARKLLKVNGAHSWFIYLNDTAKADRVSRWLQHALDPKEFEVTTWDRLAEFYKRAVALFREQLDVVRFIVIAIILLGIGNTMMMSVMERTGEIGTSMAIGIRRGALLMQFLVEGAMIGLLGGLGGLLVSYATGITLDILHIEMPPPPGLTRGYVANLLITPAIVFEAMLIALLTTTLASLYPAWKASRMVIVEAIRHNK